MRDAFTLDPALTHLNHGSFGAVPRVVQERQRAVRARAEANPMRFFRVELPGHRERARAAGAAFLGVGADEVALVRNVTEAASTVLGSLAGSGRLGPGDVVLLNEASYGAVRIAVAHWCARTGARYADVPLAVDATAADVVAGYRDGCAAVAARGETVRLVVVDQVTSPTGAVLPVRQVCEVAHAAGALALVDAAHVPGHLPVRPPETGADFWTGTWHKWGFAPRGTSALWVAGPEREATVPTTTSWNHGQAFPRPFDTHGTDDYSGWLTLEAALGFWEQAGGFGIGERGRALLDTAAVLVGDALGTGPGGGPADPAPCLRLVPLPAGVAATEADADALYRELSGRGIEAQVVAYAGRGWVRLSAAVYNEPADYERLAAVLPELVRRR